MVHARKWCRGESQPLACSLLLPTPSRADLLAKPPTFPTTPANSSTCCAISSVTCIVEQIPQAKACRRFVTILAGNLSSTVRVDGDPGGVTP